MDTRRDNIVFDGPSQAALDFLLGAGVPLKTLTRPNCIRAAHGFRAPDGWFDGDPEGPEWLVFDEPEDEVFWNWRSGELATLCGRAFALGEDALTNPGTCFLDGSLNIFAWPLTWLQRKRDGIVVLDWARLRENVLHMPRIAVSAPLADIFRDAMRERHFPSITIIDAGEQTDVRRRQRDFA